MNVSNISILCASWLAVACGGAVDDPSGEAVATSFQALSTLPTLRETDGIPECTEPGLFASASGDVIACARDAFARIHTAAGDPTLLVEVASFDGLPLPTLLATGTPTAAGTKTKKVRIEAGASGTAISEASSGPVPELDVAADCDGVVIDAETGDGWVCTAELAMLLPAVQKVREAAASALPSFRIVPRVGRGLTMDLALASGRGKPPRVTMVDGGILIDGAALMGAKTKADILIE